MANYRTSWSFGNTINATNTIEALDQAGLNFLVEKTDLLGLVPNKVCPNHVGTYRTDTGDILGVVGRNYGIVQNQVFDFADLMEGVKFTHGGYTASGLAFLVADMPDTVVNGESYTPHLIFQNSFNGGYNLKAQIVLEQNGKEYYLSAKTANIKIRHSRNAGSRVRQAQEALKTIQKYIESFQAEAEFLSTHFLSEAALDVVVSDVLFPIKENASERTKKFQMERRDAFMESYKDSENTKWFGTGWGIINAFADFNAKLRTKSTNKGGRKAESALENSLISGKAYDRLVHILEKL